MEIDILDQAFTVCKPCEQAQIDFSDPFVFLGKTDEELSLVCATARVPADTLEREDGWRGFRIRGVLDFSLIGILAGIAGVLAARGISLFAVSTYNTDYFFTRGDSFPEAIAALEQAGYRVAK